MIQEFTEQEVCTMSTSELIDEYLNRYAQEYEEFSECRADEHKTLDRCIKYIQEALAKEYESNNGKPIAVWHTKVFELAVEYYKTKDCEIDTREEKRKAEHEKMMAELKAKKEKEEKKKKQKEAEEKATLFDEPKVEKKPTPKPEPKAEAPIVQMQPKPKPQAKKPVYTETEDLFLDFFK